MKNLRIDTSLYVNGAIFNPEINVITTHVHSATCPVSSVLYNLWLHPIDDRGYKEGMVGMASLLGPQWWVISNICPPPIWEAGSHRNVCEHRMKEERGQGSQVCRSKREVRILFSVGQYGWLVR